MSIHRFEDLVAWQRARVLVKEVYLLSRGAGFARDFGLCSQIQRSAVSVMANIAEGFEKNRSTEFGRYLDISKGSLAEVRSHLYVALDIGYIDAVEFERMSVLVDDAGKVIAGLRRSLTGNLAPGTGH